MELISTNTVSNRSDGNEQERCCRRLDAEEEPRNSTGVRWSCCDSIRVYYNTREVSRK